MRMFLSAVLVVAVLCAGCSQSALPTGPTSAVSGPAALGASVPGANAAAAGHGDQVVPFKGRLEGTVTVSPLTPPFALVTIVAIGTATELGRFTLVVPHTVNFATATGVGTFTFTSANGDTLAADFTGQADVSAPVFSIVEHATITGGTGRFAGATGSFTAHRLYDPVAGTTTGSIDGDIALPRASQP
jgi:hypothetical protein